MEFSPLSFRDLPRIRRDLSRPLPAICDFSVGGIFLWRDFLSYRAAFLGDSAVYRLTRGDGSFFQCPADPDPGVLSEIAAFCRSHGEPCRFCFVPEERLPIFTEAFGASFIATEERDWADYIYEKSALITYAGKKLRGQRNHVNRFRSDHSEWTFSVATEADLPELIRFYDKFREENRKDSPSWIAEDEKILEIFAHFSEYRLICGILRAEGRIVGFSMGETVGDTLIVHVEKADRGVSGSYAMLASRLPALFESDESIRFVNREDDAGDPGLREAKLSYHPIEIRKKFRVELTDKNH